MKRLVLFYCQLAFTLVVCLFMIVPIMMSVLAGLTENYFIGLRSGLTTRWLVQVWQMYADTIWLSLYLALACLACNLLLGVPAAYGLLKTSARWTHFIEECLLMPVAIPGLATALGLLLVYGQFPVLRDSWQFILIGHVLFTLPFMIRPVLSVMQTSDMRSLEEAAASLGASFVRRFFTVVMPNCVSGILAGAFMVVTLSIGEFNITWMLHTPLTKTLPVGLADSYASMRLEVGSAYTLIFLLMIVPLLVAMQWLSKSHAKAKENLQ
ncbi:ABC transporter permease [Yersinia intermedia]|uniref:ABC transporter permease n=1 Tax=Yersinia intermedia TaxID=631 RepID=UPI000B71E56C|nr:ABC transporter permease subunit [Yersinia intermedia]MCW8114075.1 ABC transporter permease subunit [Yersinia intermedia]MDA5518874.1 ABC transporter permease subunit [Yersinia intermedia]OWF87274.1 ABC transporter permease [Yersinia intermedia]